MISSIIDINFCPVPQKAEFLTHQCLTSHFNEQVRTFSTTAVPERKMRKPLLDSQVILYNLKYIPNVRRMFECSIKNEAFLIITSRTSYFWFDPIYILQWQHLLECWIISPKWTCTWLWHFPKQHPSLQLKWMKCTMGKQRGKWQCGKQSLEVSVRGSQQPGSVFKHCGRSERSSLPTTLSPFQQKWSLSLPAYGGILQHKTRTNNTFTPQHRSVN